MWLFNIIYEKIFLCLMNGYNVGFREFFSISDCCKDLNTLAFRGDGESIILIFNLIVMTILLKWKSAPLTFKFNCMNFVLDHF